MRSYAALCLLAMMPASADAFCGFYVSGTDKKMFNDATNVVLMRAGTRTVLAMQNDYRGPLEDFAMVVPVPVVLRPESVKVVPRDVFDRIDALGAPRLVEYWEQDPCVDWELEMRRAREQVMRDERMRGAQISMEAQDSPLASERAVDRAKRAAIAPVLASFSVSPAAVTAGAATSVTWSFAYANRPWPEPACTVDHGIGAVSSGAATSVKLTDTTTFTLTCASAAGRASKQVKISVVTVEAQFDVDEYKVVILSAKEAAGLDQWLKLEGYKVPADAEALLRPYIASGSKFFVAKVDPSKVKLVGGRAALSPLRFHYDSDEFSLPIRLGLANSAGLQDLIVNIISPDRRYEVANYKNAFIPTNIDVIPAVRDRFVEFYAALFDRTLGANPGAVVTEYAWTAAPDTGTCDPCPPTPPEDADMVSLGADVLGGSVERGAYVLTRLHARYSARDMKDDLRFREAAPIAGGREVMKGGAVELGTQASPQNFFQGRYAIRHWWTGPVRCANPQRGVWGGPPDAARPTITATKAAFAPRGGMPIAQVVLRDVGEIGLVRAKSPPAPAPAAAPAMKAMWIGLGFLAGLLLVTGAIRRR